MREIKISIPISIVITIILIIVPFSVGLIIGSILGDDERQRIAERRLILEIEGAVKDGIPFYLEGSNIRLIPRKDKKINIQIAGAGAEGVFKTWEEK